jgi:hypothetical protein
VKGSDRYPRIVEWPDEDQLHNSSIPGLVTGACHGTGPQVVFAEMRGIAESLPPPATGRLLVAQPT